MRSVVSSVFAISSLVPGSAVTISPEIMVVLLKLKFDVPVGSGPSWVTGICTSGRLEKGSGVRVTSNLVVR